MLMKEWCVGVAVGLVVGALLVSTCPEARDMVEKGKKAVEREVEKLKNK